MNKNSFPSKKIETKRQSDDILILYVTRCRPGYGHFVCKISGQQLQRDRARTSPPAACDLPGVARSQCDTKSTRRLRVTRRPAAPTRRRCRDVPAH
ncbi:hypothetical protein EVAR_6741_1 [Eumeta japonica]|uniref:Uncharacterized protein n=1 Tax=Eumeta variegata TaxID=151549 RepID=A0A4C1V3K0_EUMVA|nr:hypothetical protein EVAR_6741_1 [Eumeta japonica]